ncbi:ribosome assembly cofactor RimP [Flavobacterium sp. U410]|jgi:ribosome maturation factor RimP
MSFKERVQHLLETALNERSDLFLIDLKIGEGNKINVVIDGDNGVNLQDCIDVSRAIEHNLDREEEDFSLEVASAGASSPLQLVRQYRKNLGRKLKVKMNSGEVLEADITAASDDNITLEWKTREPKKIGKGKETVIKQEVLPYSEIKEATVIISF